MYTQNIKELEESQNSVISQWKAKLLNGIVKGYINTEDSISYTCVMGNFDKESGLNFAQDLANSMNINIIINRIESWYATEDSVLHLNYDINTNNIKNDTPILASPYDMYGVKITPQLSKKLKI